MDITHYLINASPLHKPPYTEHFTGSSAHLFTPSFNKQHWKPAPHGGEAVSKAEPLPSLRLNSTH